ncbi:MAG: glycosyltransferase [Kiritimatiellae bacterium]|nr:glycosyltransferase [Kiritimatiellia bacterium]
MTFPDDLRDLELALSHDWLTGMRGGERVLEILCRWFPSAPIHTLLCSPDSISDVLRGRRIVTSRLQRVPGIAKHYRYFLPLLPAVIGRMQPPAAELLISTSHCVAKGLRVRPGTKHLCYCFTPMRYAWLFYDEYFGRNPFKKAVVKPLLAWLRRWDRAASGRVHRFVAISEHVRKRIRAFYGRDADVVYPPVNTAQFTPGDPDAPQDYDLIVSALVPYKRVALAVQAYNRLGRPLRIVGSGTQYQQLQALAAPNVRLLGWQPDEAILALYRGCRALVFPGEEDFGIVPLEAQCCGRPVIAYAQGGALETVDPERSGVFFHEQTEQALIDAVETALSRRWDPAAIRAHAERFGIQRFVDGLAASIRACLAQSVEPTRSA